jgi:pimeloyl-ACP methyl ester carboxylesterase
MVTAPELFKEAARAHGIEGVDFSEPGHSSVTVQGLTFHCVDWGGSGTPILFLHGGNQTCRTWDMVCVQIRKQYRCYALDQRNHGDTDKVPDFKIDPLIMAEDVRGVVRALGLREFVLVGMSMGGLNTMAYASKYPAELKAAVIVDVAPTVLQGGADQVTGQPSNSILQYQEFLSMEDAVEKAVKFNPLRPTVHLHYSLIHALTQRPDGMFVWKAQLRGTGGGQMKAEERQEMHQRFEGLWGQVPKILCPTLVIHGEKSRVMNSELRDKLARMLPKGEAVTIPGAGHTVQGDKPKEFVAELTRFLTRVLP